MRIDPLMANDILRLALVNVPNMKESRAIFVKASR
jgi:hypothetical protein